MNNAAFISGTEFCRHDLGIAYHAEGNSGAVIQMINFIPFNGTVKIYALIDETIIQRHAIGLMIRRHYA